LLNSPEIVVTIEAMKSGISDSGLNLTQEKFLSINVPVPPLAEQQQILTRIAVLLAHANTADREATRALTLLDRLEQSILTRAFRGELVPQDPNDEPATVALARLRGQTSAPTASRRGRPRSAT
jgi:type I restriction enzyme S subunit